MTVRVSRSFQFDAPAENVWAFISDPAERAGAISVVEGFDLDPEEPGHATWHVRLPIPVLRATVPVDTEEVERDPPRFVKFVGSSRAFRVTGEHTVEATDGGSALHNEFVVDGRLPGVERFFERNFEGELDNLEDALLRALGDGAGDS